MGRLLTFGCIGLFLLCGCYCRTYYKQNSDPRYLRGNKSFTICNQPPGVKDGKKILATVYTADPYFERLRFIRTSELPIIGKGPENNFQLGLRLETFLKLGAFPGPLLGIGLDYNYATMHINYGSATGISMEQDIKTHHTQLSFNYVTWIGARVMGYIGLQPGCTFRKRGAIDGMPPGNWQDNCFKPTFNGRISYGLQLYVRPLTAINIEAGYGNGAFVRAGLCWWVI